MNLVKLMSLCAVVLTVVGCTNNPDPIVQNQQAIDNMTLLRKLFNQTQGDSSKLNASDMAAAQKALGGSAADVQKEFDWMKTSNKTPARQ